MDQWDENNQDWTAPAPPQGPPPGVRTGRVVIATAVAVALCAAAGAGIWALARHSVDGSQGSAGSGLPLSGATSGQTTGAQTDGAVPTAAASADASNPCAAVSEEVATKFGLDAGQPDPGETHSTAAPEINACRWTQWDSDTRAIAQIRLLYTTGNTSLDSATPIAVDGVPDATASGNDKVCVVRWPTSFGVAFASVNPVNGYSGQNPCDVAAAFAGAVAPAAS